MLIVTSAKDRAIAYIMEQLQPENNKDYTKAMESVSREIQELEVQKASLKHWAQHYAGQLNWEHETKHRKHMMDQLSEIKGMIKEIDQLLEELARLMQDLAENQSLANLTLRLNTESQAISALIEDLQRESSQRR